VGAWYKWESLFSEAEKAGPVPEEPQKTFTPKNPEVPLLASYKSAATEHFWAKFPTNLVSQIYYLTYSFAVSIRQHSKGGGVEWKGGGGSAAMR
jgi:hypothetical protein